MQLFGVQGFIYRQFLTESLGWLRQWISRNDSGRLRHENRLFYLVGYVSKRYEVETGREGYSGVSDFASFLRAVLSRIARKPRPEPARPRSTQ
jgi:hypothetical protein